MNRKMFLLLSLVVILSFGAFARNEMNAYSALRQDYERGAISLDRYVENLTYIILAPQMAFNPYATLPAPKSGTMPLKEVYENWDNISEETRSRIRPFLARPWGLSQNYSTARFKLHYTTSGGDATNTAFVTAMANAFETAYTHLMTTRGYTAPPSDGTAGGDSKYDIYIKNLPAGILGYCEPEASVPSTPHNDATSFICMRNTYSGYSTNPTQLMQMVAAHEYFHAVQMGYDVGESNWWMEISSTWIEDDMYPTYNEEHDYDAAFFNNPHLSLTTFNGEHEYSSYIWGVFLKERFGVNTIRNIWEQCKWVTALSAMQGVLADLGSSRNAAFSEFFVWNLFTGARSAQGRYLERSLFPSIRIESIIGAGSYPVAGGTTTRRPDHLASNYFQLNIPSGARGPFSVSFDGQDGGIWSAQLVFPGTSSFATLNIPLDANGYGYVTVSDSIYPSFSTIYLVVGMLSTSGTGWSFVYSAAFDSISVSGTRNPPRNLVATSGQPNRVPLTWTAPIGGGSGGLEEIIYDDGNGESYIGLDAGDIEGLRFTYLSPCTLKTVKFMAYSASGYPNMILKIYPESGGYIPDTTAEIGTGRVVSPSPHGTWTEVNVASENIYFPAGDFFVGLKHTAANPAILIDTGTPAETDRCWGWESSMGFWGLSPGTGVFMIRAVVKAGARLVELTAVGPEGRPLEFADFSPREIPRISGFKAPEEVSIPAMPSPRERPEEPVLYYRLYRSLYPGGPWIWPIAEPTTESYVDLTAVDGTTYYYVVTAMYASGESGPSNQVSATPSSIPVDTTSPPMLINVDLDDTLSPLSFWPLRRGSKFAERLELRRPAKIKKLLYYVLNRGRGNFIPGIHHWTGGRIEGDLIPAVPFASSGTTFVAVNVEPYNIFVNSDFVVSFGIFDSTAFILSQRVPSDDRDWMNLGFGWFIPDSARFFIGAEIEYVDSTRLFRIDGQVSLSGGTGGSPAPTDLSGSIVCVAGTSICDTTNSSGHYTITSLRAGTYVLTASRIWYEPQSRLVSIGENSNFNFNLIPYNLPINPPRFVAAGSFQNRRVPLTWLQPIGSPGTSEWISYWEPDTMYWYRPRQPINSVECTRFDVWAPCTVGFVRISFYDSAGIYSNVMFHVWRDDGSGYPDFSRNVITPFVITPVPYSTSSGLQWTNINLDSLGRAFQLLPGDQVHVGIKHLTTHPSVVMDNSTPTERPTRSKIYDASLSNWDVELSDFLMEIRVRYFDYSGRPAPPQRTEPEEIRRVDRLALRVPDAEHSIMFRTATARNAVEFYDIYRTENIADTMSFAIIASVPGESLRWVDTGVSNDRWYYYYIKTHQSYGESRRSSVVRAYPKTFVDTAHVLLVDDDGSSWAGGVDESWAYIQALLNASIAFNGYDISTPGAPGPSAFEMSRYDAVIWFTGIMSSDSTTLTRTDENELSSYLSGGGRLALFSFDYLWDRYRTGFGPTSFPAIYFGLDSASQDYWEIESTDRAQISGYLGGLYTGMSMLIRSPFGNFAIYPDRLYADSNFAFVSDFTRTGPAVCGKTYGSFKTLFSTVPLSAMIDTTAPNTKAEFIRRTLLDYFDIMGPANIDVVYRMTPGWHMVSVPVELPNRSVGYVFPGRTGNVYLYNPATTNYDSVDSVRAGFAYFVLYTRDTTFTRTGAPVLSYSRSLSAGWNMVGSLGTASPVPFSSATFVPNRYIPGNFYRYNGTDYEVSTSFQSGVGYWVLVSGSCTMNLSSGGRAKADMAQPTLKLDFDGVKLEVGYGDDLRGFIPPRAPFGSEPQAYLIEKGERFFSVIKRDGEFELFIGKEGLMKFDNGTQTSFVIEIDGNSIELEGSGEIFLRTGTYKIRRSDVPVAFALYPAVPNPFNATTTISFDIPKACDVSLTLFDISGRVVRRLAEGDFREGAYRVVWDGKSGDGIPMPSGIYFYRLSTDTGYNSTKRLILLK